MPLFSLIINLLLGILLFAWGYLILKEHPCSQGFTDFVQEKTNSLIRGEYCIPFYWIALAFILLGLFALFNAIMLFAESRGFWLI